MVQGLLSGKQLRIVGRVAVVIRVHQVLYFSQSARGWSIFFLHNILTRLQGTEKHKQIALSTYFIHDAKQYERNISNFLIINAVSSLYCCILWS